MVGARKRRRLLYGREHLCLCGICIYPHQSGIRGRESDLPGWNYLVAKEGISTAAGEAASKITMDKTGNQTASMLAGMMASSQTYIDFNGELLYTTTKNNKSKAEEKNGYRTN